MQDQYFGDIGDFVKYGLLRQICGLTSKRGSKRKLSLGVVWYLMPNGGGNDGGNTSYLHNPEEYRECDEDLYDFLKSIVCSRRFTRKVSHIQKSGLFPTRSVYHDEILQSDGATMPKEQYLCRRKKWLARAKERVCKSDVVFCDPDNGLEVKSYDKDSIRNGEYIGGKFVFWDEAKQLYDPIKQTVIFYQHRPLKKTMDKEVKDRTREIQRNLLQNDNRVVSIRFKGNRVFFAIPAGKHGKLVFDRLHEMKDGPWARVGLEVDNH